MNDFAREAFGDIPPLEQILFYWVTAASILTFAVLLGLRMRRWLRNIHRHPLVFSDVRQRLRRFAVHVFTQPRLLRAPSAGFIHLLIFWGFLGLFIGAAVLGIGHHTGLAFFRGRFYLIFSLITDLFGIVLLVGVGMAGYRRYVVRPMRSRASGYGLPLLMLGVIGLSGFFVEGLRLAVSVSHSFDWSPGGALVARLITLGQFDPPMIHDWHRGVWWFHTLLASAFVALLPAGRMRHITAASLNTFFAAVTRPGSVLPTPFRLEELAAGTVTEVGAATAADLTPQQYFSLAACTECGLCDLVCPAVAAGRPLSPKRTVIELRDYLSRHDAALSYSPIEDVVSPQEAYSCTMCSACREACPVSVRHIELLLAVRRAVVLKSRIEPDVSAVLHKLASTGNPFGLPAAQRTAWLAGLPAGVRVPLSGETEDFDVLLWVGCAGAFDARAQRISRAVATVLSHAGMRLAVIGTAERCTGDPARRLGEEGLFQQLARSNIANLGNCGGRTIVTTCPHCLNVLKNEYQEFGGTYNVLHHSEMIATLLAQGRLNVEPQVQDILTTYHDPCYLGRHNDVYDPPRSAVTAATGSPISEMARNRADGSCCGAGGANFWFDMHQGTRINTLRYDEAAATGAGRLVTACPFCTAMFEEAAGARSPDQRLEIRDIAEIVEGATRP